MIRGTVSARREAMLPLRVCGPGGVEFDVDAVIDTGFTGFLTLPPTIISTLNLSHRSHITARLGDGTIRQLNVYDAEIEWDGVWRTILVSEVDGDALLGMGLLAGHELWIEVVPGGVVDITPLP